MTKDNTDPIVSETEGKDIALQNLYKAKDMPTKLMWQNVYFWFIRNNK